jgi:hypothetical protein
MSIEFSEEQPADDKPVKKTNRYRLVLKCVLGLWIIGGLNMLLLQDIPLLLFGIVVVGLFAFPALLGLLPAKR